MNLRLENSTRNQPCDVCEGTDFQLIGESDRHGQPLRTVVCCRCGLISHEQIPTDTQLAEYYTNQYRQDYHGEVLPSNHRILRAWKGGVWLLNRLRRYVPDGSEVCEIGAGIGCTVKAFELAGYNAVGIEPGQGFHQFANESLLARITCEGLYDLPARPTYDFLLLVHVIEHFNSPRRALMHMRDLLHPGGQIYVECPNIAAPHAAPGKQFHVAHIYNFTPETLVRLAETCGLSTVARLADARCGTLRYIFAPTRRPPVPDFTGAYERVIEQLQQQTAWKYYARPSYILRRLSRDVRFLSHRAASGLRVRWLLHTCQRAQARRELQAEPVQELRRAA